VLAALDGEGRQFESFRELFHAVVAQQSAGAVA
jgi:hypothetical protein